MTSMSYWRIARLGLVVLHYQQGQTAPIGQPNRNT